MNHRHHAQRLGALDLGERRYRKVLDAEARLLGRVLLERVLKSVEGPVHRTVAQAVDSNLHTPFMGVGHQGIGLLLCVVDLPHLLGAAVGVMPRISGSGKHRVHEHLHGSAPETVRHVAIAHFPTGHALGWREETVRPEHLVQGHGNLILAIGGTVQLRGIRHDQSIANAGYPAGQVPQAVALDQTTHVVAVVVQIGSQGQIVHRVHGAFPERPVWLAAVLTDDAAVGRVGRIPVDARQPKGGRVGVAGVDRAVHDANRIVRRRLVQLPPGYWPVFLQPRGPEAPASQPYSSGQVPGCGGNGVFDAVDGGMGRNAAVDRDRFKGVDAEVIVGVDECRQQRPARQMNNPGGLSHELGHLSIGADGHYLAVLHGYGFGAAVPNVHRQQVATHQYQVHGPPPYRR